PCVTGHHTVVPDREQAFGTSPLHPPPRVTGYQPMLIMSQDTNLTPFEQHTTLTMLPPALSTLSGFTTTTPQRRQALKASRAHLR
ncbi:Hypothetical predicted protein, partial [Pelobates cultripes]